MCARRRALFFHEPNLSASDMTILKLFFFLREQQFFFLDHFLSSTRQDYFPVSRTKEPPRREKETMAGKMTVDELLGNMPKMMRIADDMHDMVR